MSVWEQMTTQGMLWAVTLRNREKGKGKDGNPEVGELGQ